MKAKILNLYWATVNLWNRIKTHLYALFTLRKIIIETEETESQYGITPLTFFCSLKTPFKRKGTIHTRKVPEGQMMYAVAEAVKIAEKCCVEEQLPPTATFIHIPAIGKFPVTIIANQVWRE